MKLIIRKYSIHISPTNTIYFSAKPFNVKRTSWFKNVNFHDLMFKHYLL